MAEVAQETSTEIEEAQEVIVEESANAVALEYGAVRVAIGGALKIPERSGRLSAVEVSRVPRAPRGLGLASEQAADAMEKAQAEGFVPPAGVTPQSLRHDGAQAEDIDVYIHDMQVVLDVLKQANLLLDAAAYEALRRLNDQVKAQAKFQPQLNKQFANLLRFFERVGGTKAAVKK